MLGLGGGGWAGILDLLAGVIGTEQGGQPGLTRGYATAQTDGGHRVRRVSTRRGSAITPLQSPISATVPFTR